MITSFNTNFRRFLKSEEGTSTVAFALWVPLFIGVIISGVELAALTARHTVLESSLDKTVREVRLGTGTIYDHNSLKTSICEKATILPECEANLQLEMVRLDLRDWTAPPAAVACVDTSDEVEPVVAFEYGRDNELMFLRACYRYKPVAPTTAMGSSLPKDSEGYTAIISTSAFVQEPS
ncbi:hypothetical protein SAMN04488045_0311 [Thalassococcus halodurans]|uniref:Flp pilus assembly protein TadG n=1 Tax=Thalassococcus halodurans TaxID=373675 RepID=A0A1H5SQL9_9RHOB|nr:hypothetical protein [Thalassococcus halodurans]SEF52141.1 hypothetical protein SAMN04488045_0311 [Thalassococcus halodurans]